MVSGSQYLIVVNVVYSLSFLYSVFVYSLQLYSVFYIGLFLFSPVSTCNFSFLFLSIFSFFK